MIKRPYEVVELLQFSPAGEKVYLLQNIASKSFFCAYVSSWGAKCTSRDVRAYLDQLKKQSFLLTQSPLESIITLEQVGYTDNNEIYCLTPYHKYVSLENLLNLYQEKKIQFLERDVAYIAKELLQIIDHIFQWEEEDCFRYTLLNPKNIFLESETGKILFLTCDLDFWRMAYNPNGERKGFYHSMYSTPTELEDYQKRFSKSSYVYRLGSILYYMLTGQAPFAQYQDQPFSSLVHVILNETPPPVNTLRKGIPPILTRLLAAMLQKDNLRDCARLLPDFQGQFTENKLSRDLLSDITKLHRDRCLVMAKKLGRLRDSFQNLSYLSDYEHNFLEGYIYLKDSLSESTQEIPSLPIKSGNNPSRNEETMYYQRKADKKQKELFLEKNVSSAQELTAYQVAKVQEEIAKSNEDFQKARALYQKAQGQGCSEADFALYWHYQVRGKSLKNAMPFLEKAASKKYPPALAELSARCRLGEGTEKDLNRSEVLLGEMRESSKQHFCDLELEKGLQIEFRSGYSTSLDEAKKAIAMYQNTSRGSYYAARLLLSFVELRDEKKIFDFFHQSVENCGHLRSLFHLGICYLHGMGTDREPMRALQLWQEASWHGSPEASLLVNLFEAMGKDLFSENKDLLDKMVEQKRYLIVGDCYRFGLLGVKRNRSNAYQNYLSAAEMNNPEGMQKLGYLLLEKWKKRDYVSRAFSWFEKAYGQGSLTALIDLGLLYEYSFLGFEDVGKAEHYYRKAAEKGCMQAMIMLADRYTAKNKFPDYFALAFDWYFRAAELGNGYAMYQIAKAYLDGFFLEQSYERSYKWFLDAYEEKYAGALSGICQLYRKHRDLEIDWDLIEENTWQLSAKDDNASAFYTLGKLYLVDQNLTDIGKAIRFLEKAARLGSQESVRQLVQVYESPLWNCKDSAKSDYWRNFRSPSN